jgi:processive 1,2-diacylglycerol beta-glucosyltransferase
MDKNMQLSVVCGSNKAMYNELTAYIPPADNVHIYGFCDNIPLLMDSAELLMTKPGGISVTEAAVKTLPMVLIDAVAGCEKPNMEYFVKNGYAITGNDPIETAESCMQLLSDDQSRREMAYALEHLANINDKEIIYEILKVV